MNHLSWSEGLRRDGVQLSSRLQTIIRFQIAADLQGFLDKVFDVQMQILFIIILIVVLEISVRKLHLTSLALLRAVVVIQSGQILLTYIDHIDRKEPNSSYPRTFVTSWLITTASLCIPGMMTSSVQNDNYVSNAITVFLYQYTDATRDIVTVVDLGISPLYISILCVVLAIRLRYWNLHPSTQSIMNKHDKPQNNDMYLYFFTAFHMLVVELLLFSIQNLTMHLNPFVQVLLQMIAILTIDSLNQDHLLEEVRGYTIWRVSRMLLTLKFDDMQNLDAIMTSAVATLIYLSRRLPFIHSMYTSAQSLHTLSEIVFLASMNLILRPITSQTNGNVQVQLLLILFISTIAQAVQHVFSIK